MKKTIAALLVFAFLFSVGGFAIPAAAEGGNPSVTTKEAGALFRAKFEGNAVAGSGENVDGVYRFTATQTDGEAWHVKLESNYPTVAGRDYRVTYRFTSDVAGTVKFGDFQEYPIQKGENSVTGMMIATGGTSYLDLQLGMLRPFTIDFKEIEVQEFADEVDYEDALSSPVNFEREKSVYEKHDQGYAPVLTRSRDEVSINYLATSWDSGVWKSKLYVKTGLIPESGVRYRITADVGCDQDMPFEVLFNDADIEKGYGALYGQSVAAGETTTCEAVITGSSDGDELVLQFSLGEAPEESTVNIGSLHVEKIKDHYSSILPASFALNKQYATGKIITEYVPVSYAPVSMASFSYDGSDSVYEGHDDGYLVRMDESASSVTMDVYQAPAAPENRGVWKAKMLVDTGAKLEVGQSYKVDFDLVPEKDQAEYEVCFDGGSEENAFGALYGRSLTAGTADHISRVITPTEDHGPLKLRLQLGKTDTAAGNKFTLQNLTVESVPVEYTDILPETFSYNTQSGNDYVSVLPESFSYQSGTTPSGEWTSVLPASFAYPTGDGAATETGYQPVELGALSAREEHAEGYVQTLDNLALTVSGAPERESGVWSSKLFIDTGVKLAAGTKYKLRVGVRSEKAMDFEICFNKGGEEKGYGALYGQNLPENELKFFLGEIEVPADASTDNLVLQLMVGKSPAPNTITVDSVYLDKVIPAHPATGTVPEGYQPVALSGVTQTESHDEGYEQTLSGNTLTVSAVPTLNIGVWTSKLFVNTGTALEAGAKYKVTANLSSAKAMDFEICYNNGSAEKGYGALYGQSIAEGGSGDYVGEFEVGADASTDALILQFMVGKSPAENTITVNSVKVEKLVPEHQEKVDVAAGYKAVSTGLSLGEGHDPGYEQTLGGNTLTISAVPESDTGVWKSKVYADTGTALQPGGKYQVTANISSAKAMGFEICFNNGAVEKGYGALYGLSIGEGGSASYSGEFTVPADATAANLVLQFQFGSSPAGNSISINSVTLEKYEDAHEETVTVKEAYVDVPLSELTATDAHDAGYEQSVSGTALTISAIPTLHNGVWSSKLFVDTGAKLQAGAKYRVKTSLRSAKAMDFEICYNNGAAEKGYSALYGQHIGDNETKEYACEFQVPADATADKLILQLQLGNTPADNSITVNSVTLEKWEPEHQGTITVEESGEPVPLSLNAYEQHAPGFQQSVSGTALTITELPNFGVWSSKLFVDTGIKLEPGAKYRVTAKISSTKAVDFEICYNNGTAEKGYSALYGQNIGDGAAKACVHEFTVAADAAADNLVLQFMLGNCAAPTTFTVRSVTVDKWVGEGDAQPLDPKSFELWAQEEYKTSLSGDGSSASVTFTSAPEGREVWKTKLFANTGVKLEAGKAYRISADVQASTELPYEICYNDGGEEKGVGAKYGLTASAQAQTVTLEVTPDKNADLVLQFSLGNAETGSVVTVSNIKVEADSQTSLAPVHFWADGGYSAALSSSASSATLDISAVPASDQTDWKLKLFVETGAKLQQGKRYRIRYDLNADADFLYHVFYNNGDAEQALGAEWNQNAAGGQTVEHFVTPGSDATLVIQLMLGYSPAGNRVTVSNVQVDELVGGSAPINNWAHEDYEASLSNTGSSATIDITRVPDSGREAWKVKLFAETGAKLEAGKTYRVSVDVQASTAQGFEICYNNLEHEQALGGKFGLTASPSAQTFVNTVTPESDAVLTLQFNLGNAPSANAVTISGIKVEEAGLGAGSSVIPNFSYDSVGYFRDASDYGYVVALDQHEKSVDFRIDKAPDERHPWNVKLNVRTGFTPENGKGCRVTFDITAAKPQSSFEVFYDGSSEAVYGAQYGMSLAKGKNTVSFVTKPNDNYGELVLQIRLGETDGTDGNSYTISNIKLDEATLRKDDRAEIKPITELATHETYLSNLDVKRDKATVKVVRTPATGREAWKNKLFVHTGVTLKAGQKYRVSMDVKSIIPAPFEVCFNKGDEEKGIGAIFGLISTPSGQYVEYVTYPKQDAELVIQLSLGNCTPPNSIILSNVEVEQAGTISMVSDTIYTY